MVLRLIADELLTVLLILASKPSWGQDQILAGRENEKYFVPNLLFVFLALQPIVVVFSTAR
jgi:hypothetical protein